VPIVRREKKGWANDRSPPLISTARKVEVDLADTAIVIAPRAV
jgi:hypothetical protein